MPTIIGNTIVGYTYKEVDDILVETDEYKKKIQEYQEYADSEDLSIEEAYEGLGFDNTWIEENKQLKISGMIKEKKLKTYHHRKDDVFYYYLN